MSAMAQTNNDTSIMREKCSGKCTFTDPVVIDICVGKCVIEDPIVIEPRGVHILVYDPNTNITMMLSNNTIAQIIQTANGGVIYLYDEGSNISIGLSPSAVQRIIDKYQSTLGNNIA
jgi:hypothetical protein